MNGDRNPGVWCILRTSGSRTLPVAKSLAAAGFDVWTPVETNDRRRPRSKATVEFEAPIMPTFVFARADRLKDLEVASQAAVKEHPPFSLFRWAGKIPLVSDQQIASLRAAEDRATARTEAAHRRSRLQAERKFFTPGDQVKVTEGSFSGLSGMVEDGDGKFTFVAFGGSMRVKIASFLLASDQVEAGQLCMSTAA